jgi:hypothetical protein
MLIVLAQSIYVQPTPSLMAALDPAQACPAAWLLRMTGCETHAPREVAAKAQRLLPLQKSSTANMDRAHARMYDAARPIEPTPSLMAALDPAQACPAAWLLRMTGCETHAPREVAAKAQRLLPLQKSSTANMDRAHARMYDAARPIEPTPSLMAALDPAQACPAAWLLRMTGCETHAPREVAAKAQRLLPLQKSSTANMDRAHARMYDAARPIEPTPSLMAALDPAQACPAAWLLRMSDFVVLLIA